MAPTDDVTDKANSVPPNKPVKSASALQKNIFAFELSEGTKRFAKRYRTEISSGSSTVMSTFFAVCCLAVNLLGLLADMLSSSHSTSQRAACNRTSPPICNICLPNC